MTESSQSDRRRVPRYPVRVPVTLVANLDSRPVAQGHTVDVSVEGLRIVTDSHLSHGAQHTLSINTSAGPILARTEVIWAERRGSQSVQGLRITDIDPAAAVRLGQLITDGA